MATKIKTLLSKLKRLSNSKLKRLSNSKLKLISKLNKKQPKKKPSLNDLKKCSAFIGKPAFEGHPRDYTAEDINNDMNHTDDILESMEYVQKREDNPVIFEYNQIADNEEEDNEEDNRAFPYSLKGNYELFH